MLHEKGVRSAEVIDHLGWPIFREVSGSIAPSQGSQRQGYSHKDAHEECVSFCHGQFPTLNSQHIRFVREKVACSIFDRKIRKFSSFWAIYDAF